MKKFNVGAKVVATSLLLVCVLLLGEGARGSNRTLDSLKVHLAASRSGQEKVRVYSQLARASQNESLIGSVKYMLAAIDEASNLKNDTLVIGLRRELGYYFFYQGLYDQAIRCFIDYYNYYSRQDKNSKKLLLILPNIGAVYNAIQNYPKATHYYQESEKLYRKYQGSISKEVFYNGIVTLYNNLGNIYTHNRNYPQATAYYFKGLTMAEQQNDLEMVGNYARNIGELYREKHDLDSAYIFFKRSYDVRMATSNVYGLSTICISLSAYYSQKGEYDKALDMLVNAKNYSTKINALDILINVEQNFYNLYRMNGKTEEALLALERYQSLSDSMKLQERAQSVERAQMMLEFQKKELELKEKQENRQLLFFLIIAAVVVVFSYLLLIYLFQKSRLKWLELEHYNLELEKINLKQDLDLKNKELTTNMLYLMQKNELIGDVVKRIKREKDYLETDGKSRMDQILKDLKQVLEKGSWSEFEIRFQQVNSEFYDRLTAQYPDLTPQERRLCAFLHLNMTTKEIAALTGQNASAVEMARHRLRKRLNISNPNVSLVQFFSEF